MYRNDYAVVCRKRPPVFTAADRRETPTPSASVFAADLGMGNWERLQPCADTVCDHLRPNLRCKTASAYTIKEKWRGVDRIRISHVKFELDFELKIELDFELKIELEQLDFDSI
nr:hypothetical protein Iba_scaffold21539CG0350 [Ipomoea batatas]